MREVNQNQHIHSHLRGTGKCDLIPQENRKSEPIPRGSVKEHDVVYLELKAVTAPKEELYAICSADNTGKRLSPGARIVIGVRHVHKARK